MKPNRRRPSTRALFSHEIRRLAALPGAAQAWVSVRVRVGGQVSTYHSPVTRQELARLATDMEDSQ